MNAKYCLLAVSLFLSLQGSVANAQGSLDREKHESMHHKLSVAFDLAKNTMQVEDTITLPQGESVTAHEVITIRLHKSFTINSWDGADVRPLDEGTQPLSSIKAPAKQEQLDSSGHHAMARSNQNNRIEEHMRQVTSAYGVRIHDDSHRFTIRYSGPIPNSAEATIKKVEIFGHNYWVPTVRDALHQFTLQTSGLPHGWYVVAAGDRQEDGHIRSWHYVDAIHLLAAPWNVQKRLVNNVEVEVLLQTEDTLLSERYLGASSQYLQLYSELIGPFPYKRLSIVEANAGAGFAVPGAMLIGPRLLRYPFILTSSFPHEVLHNWLGNSVFPDDAGGNWTEGLTTYLSDYLLQEVNGKAADYRATTLARYKDYVTEKDDFKLRHFVGGRTRASQAVGYGKWMMVIHMLRQHIGDDAFRRSLRTFYQDNAFRRAGFHHFRRALEKESGKDLKGFFRAYVDREGAPILGLSHAQRSMNSDGTWNLQVDLSQEQGSRVFPTNVPLLISFEDGSHAMKRAPMRHKSMAAAFRLKKKPMRVDLDPYFDIFRLLKAGEIAPRFSQLLSDKDNLFILPSVSSAKEIESWNQFIDIICRGKASRCSKAMDNTEVSIVSPQNIWVLGYTNLLRGAATVGLMPYGARLDDYFFRYQQERFTNSSTSIALSMQHATSPNHALAFIGTPTPEQLPTIARKLKHYGSYGHLLFSKEAEVTFKGKWTENQTPNTFFLEHKRTKRSVVDHDPLTPLPSPFERNHMLRTIAVLDTRKVKNRSIGSKGHQRALQLLEKEFTQRGLERPEGALAQGLQHCWQSEKNDSRGPVSCNVVGVVRGQNRRLPPIVVGARFDSLPSEKKELKVRQKRGNVSWSNNNSGGLSVMLELASLLRTRQNLKRDVIFVAYSGLGPRHTNTPPRFHDEDMLQPSSVRAMIDLDLTPNPKSSRLMIAGVEPESAWISAVSQAARSTQNKLTLAFQSERPTISASNAFHLRNIPAIHLQLQSEDKQRPLLNDDETDHLIDSASLAFSILQSADSWDRNLLVKGSKGSSKQAKRNTTSLGIVPKYRYTGPGVLLDAVGIDTPAAQAGFEEGDIILQVDQFVIKSMRQYSLLLRRKKAGETIIFKVRRDQKEFELSVTVPDENN